MTIKIYDIIDVSKVSDLPQLSKGKKFYEFLGGDKNLRCYIVDDFITRAEFIKQNENLLDDCLKPIYLNNNIRVGQDTTYAIPGFYIINPEYQVPAFDKDTSQMILRLTFIARVIRRGLRELYNINTAKIYCEEKITKTSNIHFWVLPIHRQIMDNPRILGESVLKYLKLFNFKDTREKILHYNDSMHKFLQNFKLIEKDNKLLELLKDFKE